MKIAALRFTTRAAMVAIVLTLAACGGGSNGYGGGGGDGLDPMQREDRAASASSAGLLDFARTQIDRATDETSEPRNIDGITPPVDDTAEPFVL